MVGKKHLAQKAAPPNNDGGQQQVQANDDPEQLDDAQFPSSFPVEEFRQLGEDIASGPQNNDETTDAQPQPVAGSNRSSGRASKAVTKTDYVIGEEHMTGRKAQKTSQPTQSTADCAKKKKPVAPCKAQRDGNERALTLPNRRTRAQNPEPDENNAVNQEQAVVGNDTKKSEATTWSL